jgi:FkbM family methyltransferase
MLKKKNPISGEYCQAFLGMLRALYWSTPIPHSFQCEPETSWLSTFVRKGDWIIDVGASVGLYTVALSRAVGPNGRIFAFEPCPASHALLARVLRVRRMSNVRLERVAIADTSGRIRLMTPSDARGAKQPPCTHVISGEDHESQILDVTSMSIDDYCLKNGIQNVRVVKVDIEGYELFALRGAKELIGRARPVLLVEIERRHTTRYGYQPEYIWEEILSYGYSAFVVGANGGLSAAALFANSHWNFLFIPVECAPNVLTRE